MNKKLNKLLLLSLLPLSLVGCSGDHTDDSSDNIDNVISVTSDDELHFQEGTLHDADVKESDRVFVDNGHSDYKIYYEEGDSNAKKAASTIATHIESATGICLSVDSLPENLTDDHFILLGDSAYQASKNIPVSDKALGPSGYQIVTKENAVYIRVEGEYGYQQAAITFLKHVIGFTRYSYNIVKYTKDGKTLPDINIVERPDVTFHTQSNKISNTASYEMGFLTTSETFYSDSNIQSFHNSFDYLPKENSDGSPSEYYTYHPKWYSDGGDQICYTAHGDSTELDAMVNEVYGKMVEKLKSNKTVGALTFTIQDNANACTCSACRDNVAKYGAESGSVVVFCNKLDDKIQAYLEAEAEKTGEAKRELNILFFAYHRTEKPCVKLGADGKYIPTSPDVVCNEHVGPYIAPISACYTKSFYDEDNSNYANYIKGWGALSNKVYLWFYETNFSHYLYPLNTYDTMIESYRFAYENNGMYMYNEGQHNNGAVTCFGRFKEYLNSVSLFDVNTDYNDIVDDFFTNYFGDAKNVMLKYFHELQEQCEYIETTYSSDINGTIYNNIAQSRFWPKKLLDRWVDYIEEGKEAILKCKDTNRTLYEALYENLTLESIFPRYALINHYSGKYSSETIKNLRKSFKEDCNKVNVTYLNENATMDSVFNSWGL